MTQIITPFWLGDSESAWKYMIIIFCFMSAVLALIPIYVKQDG